MKRCIKCEQEFPATTEYFHPRHDSPDGLRNNCRVCQNAKSKKYHQGNIDAIHEYDRAYYQANHERLLEKQRRYEERNRDRARERSKQYRLKNPSKYKDWIASNPTRARAYKTRRGARKQGLPDNFTSTDWQFALDYFKGCCAVCGRPPGFWHILAADHWIPLIDPDCPGTIPINIVPLCHGNGGCNNRKNAQLPEQWVITTFGKREGKAILLRVAEFFTHVRQLD